MRTIGEQLKQLGLDLVERGSPEFIEQARQEARRLARAHGSVSSDQLRHWAAQKGLKPHHPNVWGVVFRGDEWQRIGYRPSQWASAHARVVSVWRLLGQGKVSSDDKRDRRPAE